MREATRLYEELIEVMRGMPLPPQEPGRAVYQLACFYVVTEQFTSAIEGLKLAMQLEPGIIAWSKQDKALDALRNFPAFQALYVV